MKRAKVLWTTKRDLENAGLHDSFIFGQLSVFLNRIDAEHDVESDEDSGVKNELIRVVIETMPKKKKPSNNKTKIVHFRCFINKQMDGYRHACESGDMDDDENSCCTTNIKEVTCKDCLQTKVVKKLLK